MIGIDSLNALSTPEFVAALHGIFEHSPWVAERAASARPFQSSVQLLDAMRSVVRDASNDEQLTLIRAHPELAGKAAIRKELTAESTREQKGAGLDSCTPQEYARLHELNAAYREKFSFPFIIAVKGHTPATIISAMEQRLGNDGVTEQRTALEQIGRIAGFRLADRFTVSYGAEIMAMLDKLAQFSEQHDALTCSYLSPTHRQTADQIRDWMLAAGLDAHIDAIGNVVGRMHSTDRNAKALVTGSHYDTVINGGRYDGRLGIVVPIVVALSFRQRGIALPFNLEIVAFADEEGVRYRSTFLGSSALAGSFDLSLLDSVDGNGVRMREALESAGLDPSAIPTLARDPQQLLGFIEIHIEQGPVLLDEGRSLGVVTGIAGSVRLGVTITGRAGHAGTVPMNMRQDAAAAAAELVLAVEHHCSDAPGLVGTVGKIQVPDGAINVIPGRCELTIDVRAGDDATRDAALADVLGEIESIAKLRNVRVDVQRLMQAAAAPCSEDMQRRWAQSIARVTGDDSPRHLPSGAGHDAMKMADITPIGMLFVRCGNGGISHHPDETMIQPDAELAALALEDFLLQFAEEPPPRPPPQGGGG